jgi:uncharacterized membrane protein
MHAFAATFVAASHPLPEPSASWTIPIGIVLVVLALFALVRKLIFLGLLAAIIAVLFFVYQGGGFDKYVDKGKQVVHNQNPTSR